jgi:hypothetical protein
MWRFHWHWKDADDTEQTTTQTAVPIGEQIPLPPDVAAGTLTHVTLEPETNPVAADETGAAEPEPLAEPETPLPLA